MTEYTWLPAHLVGGVLREMEKDKVKKGQKGPLQNEANGGDDDAVSVIHERQTQSTEDQKGAQRRSGSEKAKPLPLCTTQPAGFRW